MLATVLGVAAALWLHRPGETGTLTMPSDLSLRGRAPESMPAPLAGGVGDLAGLADLDRLPADLVMPPEATRQSLVRYRRPGIDQVKAEYATTAPAEQTLRFLQTELPRNGWRLVQWLTEAGDTRSGAIFESDGDTLTVRLNRRGVFVNIVAVINRAGPAGPAKP